MSFIPTRREFLKQMGLSAAALPFVFNLPSLGFANQQRRKQRMVVIFTPNGVVPWNFWPDEQGEQFTLKESLTPLSEFKDRTLVLKGVCDRIRGDGDSHMRGIGCLLTGIELFPGNIQGGSDTPAGWSTGHSIDQELRTFLQADAATRTRFGSLEFGVMVPDRADTWTRMVYRGPNEPIAPIDDPYLMFNRLYGRAKDKAVLGSVLDDLRDDLAQLSDKLNPADRRLLDQHATFVREMEQELKAGSLTDSHPEPQLDPNVSRENDNIPQISRMQIELMVQSFAADFTRLSTLQYTNSVGQARMKWIGVEENHHELSHNPDDDQASQEKLTKINKWFCEQVAYLAKRLSETPEPGGEGSLLDNTLIVWTNELGQGNSHTLDNIPFVLVGNGLDFQMGRSIHFQNVPHNRLLLSFAHGFGHRIEKFGNPEYCGGGPLSLT
jgi:hypothetical protein